jgi:hypothetical protein
VISFNNKINPKWYDRLSKLAVVASVVILIGSIWYNQFLPLQDYPEWLFQSRLIHMEMQNSQQNVNTYSVSWFPLPPNSIVSIVLALLQYFVPVRISGKLFLSAYILLFVAGWRYFFSRLYRYHPFRWFGIIFVFNYFFFMGYLSYITGISVLFLGLGWLHQNRRYSWRTMTGILCFSLLLYLIHGIPYFIFCAAVIWSVIFYNGEKLGRRYPLLLSLAPSVVLFVLYLAFKNEPSRLDYFPSVFLQLKNWAYAISFYNRLIPFQQSLPLSWLNIAVFIFLISVIFGLRKSFTPSPLMKHYLPMAVAAAMIVILNPVARVGEFFGINQRFVIPAIVFIFASFNFSERKPAVGRSAAVAGLVLSILYFVQISQFNAGAEKIYDAVKPYYNKAETPLFIGKGFAEEFDKDYSRRYSAGIRTMIHFRRYFDMEKPPKNFITFGSGLLHVNNSVMDAAIVALDSCADKYQYAAETIQALKSGVCGELKMRDYIFVLGSSVVLNQFDNYLSAFYKNKIRKDNVLILSEYQPDSAVKDEKGKSSITNSRYAK